MELLLKQKVIFFSFFWLWNFLKGKGSGEISFGPAESNKGLPLVNRDTRPKPCKFSKNIGELKFSNILAYQDHSIFFSEGMDVYTGMVLTTEKDNVREGSKNLHYIGIGSTGFWMNGAQVSVESC